VKVIHRQFARDAEVWRIFLARFHREADATAALDHANIVPIYEYGETGELAYLVMPYLPDGSLATMLEQHGPLTLPQTVLAARALFFLPPRRDRRQETPRPFPTRLKPVEAV
jgi:serine/threonine protein kinase